MTDASVKDEAGSGVDDTPEDDVEMTFFEHLVELRGRLIKALAGILPGLGIAWYFKDTLTGWFSLPLKRANETETITSAQLIEWFLHPIDVEAAADTTVMAELYQTGLTDVFMVQLVMAAIVGLLIASPWVFWQLWAFISPGLYRREKRLAVPFMLVATFFFGLGVYFCFTLVLPLAYQTLLGMGGDIAPGLRVTDFITIDKYLTLTSKLMLGFGLTFLVPVVIAFMSLVGWSTGDSSRSSAAGGCSSR